MARGKGWGSRRVIRLVVERSGLGETTRTSGDGREQTKATINQAKDLGDGSDDWSTMLRLET